MSYCFVPKYLMVYMLIGCNRFNSSEKTVLRNKEQRELITMNRSIVCFRYVFLIQGNMYVTQLRIHFLLTFPMVTTLYNTARWNVITIPMILFLSGCFENIWQTGSKYLLQGLRGFLSRNSSIIQRANIKYKSNSVYKIHSLSLKLFILFLSRVVNPGIQRLLYNAMVNFCNPDTPHSSPSVTQESCT